MSAPADLAAGNGRNAAQRIDLWLFYARLLKSRALAAKFAADGLARINRQKTAKASALVRPGDILTLSLPGRILVCRVEACGARRGPFEEARLLYSEMTEP